jgi:retron-type reverse transcriptase
MQAIALKAEMQPGHRFQNLFGMLNKEMLKTSWRFSRKDSAFGIYRLSADEYEQSLDKNILQLVEDLKRKRSRAKLVLKRNMPKGNGMFRPLGLVATQDKLLQLAVKRILQAGMSRTFWIVALDIVRTSEHPTQ